MQLRNGNRNGHTLSITLQKPRRTQERIAKGGWMEKYENGEPTRRPETSEEHAGIYRENKKIRFCMINRRRDQ